jgi:GH24 family phage-related lysozyme (muramidase)
MHQSVRDGFIAFTAPLEGVVTWMYLDVKGFVTVGIGNLIDPVSTAIGLPFVKPDGAAATKSEIAAAWQNVKSHTELAQQGYRPAARVSDLRLTNEGVEQIVLSVLDRFAKALLGHYPDFESWPADAQLATLSMAWACGPAFHLVGFTALEAALKGGDFARAAVCCHMNETNNAGLKPRNLANRQLYMNAARVLDWKLDPESLAWPAVLEDSVPTEPELPRVDDPVVHPDIDFPTYDIHLDEHDE